MQSALFTKKSEAFKFLTISNIDDEHFFFKHVKIPMWNSTEIFT